MNAILSLSTAIFLCIVLIASNMVESSCAHPVFIIALNTVLLLSIMVFTLMYAKSIGEKYDPYSPSGSRRVSEYSGERLDYDFSKSDPNVTVNGDLVAGTVYAAYPEQTGGLGWIL